MTNPTSIFDFAGFNVTAVDSGVYCLKPKDAEIEHDLAFVGLLYADKPLEQPRAEIQLYLQPVTEKDLLPRVAAHWKTLDARRLAESGLTAMPLVLGSATLANLLGEHYARPDGRVRYAVKLQSGDVICYN